MMDTATYTRTAPRSWTSLLSTLLASAAILFLTAACQKHCQAPSTTTYRSVTEAQWRLVETTDPKLVQNLDNFNFLIVQFATNSTGTVNRVVNNEQYETPISTLAWVPNSKAKTMRIQYTSVPTQQANGSTPPVQQGDLGTFDYQYYLGRDLEMTELQTGNYYRYVPFTGVVSPDIDCTF